MESLTYKKDLQLIHARSRGVSRGSEFARVHFDDLLKYLYMDSGSPHLLMRRYDKVTTFEPSTHSP